MAKTLTTMPSSINTTSTENDSMNSPDGKFRTIGHESPVTSDSSPATSPRENRNGYDKLPPQQYEPYNKRKRTTSLEDAAQSPRRYDYSPPKRVEPQHVAGQALHAMADAHSGNEYYPHNTNGRPEYWNHERDESERHTMENGEDDDMSPPPPGTAGQMTDSNGSPPSRGGGSVHAPGKRKRNFSNRTKTGCMTCRSRKKKCDEGRPICNNCSRGGFQCQGYTVVRGVWPKANTNKGPVPLQAKEGQQQPPPPPQQQHHPHDTMYKNDEPNQTHPTHSTHPTHHNHAPTHLTPVDIHSEPSHIAYHAPPESRNRSSYSGQGWPPQQGHPPYTTAEPLPPLSELARPDTSKPDYTPVPPHRDMSRPPPQPIPPTVPPAPNPQSGHWPAPTQAEYRPPYPPPRLDTHSVPPRRAPASSYDYPKPRHMLFTMEEVERSKMCRNDRFKYFDPTLKNDRQRCAEALARYNSACMLRSGVTEQEAQNMLMKVFDPSLDITHHSVAPCMEKGQLGPGVKIEGPFKCTYGYNIRIMDNVFIGENTRIDDSALVDIGARTWIGPNVSILTTDVGKDLVDRKGTESLCIAHPVTIQSEVVIGSNAVIYPGVTLGRGSTVEPFALVRESLGDHMVQRAVQGPRTS